MGKIFFSFDELLTELAKIEIDEQKVIFLEKYLKENSNLSLELIAKIYELLGDFRSSASSKASFYRKSASTWEMVSILDNENVESSEFKRESLKQAAKNYKKAAKIYRSEGSFSSSDETWEKYLEVHKELKNYGGVFRTVTLWAIVLSFIFSFFLLSPPLTGYVTTVEKGEASIVGFFMTLLAIIGVFFFFRKWT